jgi:hypothetical protein
MNSAVPLFPLSDSLISKDAEDKPGIKINIYIYISLPAFSKIASTVIIPIAIYHEEIDKSYISSKRDSDNQALYFHTYIHM